MNEGPRVLLVSDDDDIAQPVALGLRQGGYRVAPSRSRTAPDDLAGSPPDVLVLDGDLPAEARRLIGEHLARQAGRGSLPLVLLGDAGPEGRGLIPADWHEDAVIVLSRPASPGEVVIAVRAVLRLAFYRGYRDLVHDLSQPVTVLHALSDALAREVPPGAAHHDRVMRLRDEAERIMSLMERFQRRRAGRDR